MEFNMFVRKTFSKTRNTVAVQIVENRRINGKVRQRIVKHIGMADNEEKLQELMVLAESIMEEINNSNTPQLSLFEPQDLEKIKEDNREERYTDEDYNVDIRALEEESRVITGIHEVYGEVFEQLDFKHIFYNPARKKQSVEYFKQIVLARIANPDSKRASALNFEEHFGVSLKLDSIYKMMDKIDDKTIERLNNLAFTTTKKLFNNKIDVIFFDATTIYFESFTEDDFKRNGYSKDLKFNQPQVLLALMVTKEGLPIGYKAYSGNTYEGHTFLPAIKSLKEEYDIDNVIFVADSGMLNKININEIEKLESNGISYIVGARLKGLPDKLKESILNIDNYKQINKTTKLGIFKHKCRKLIVTYSAKRARKDAKDREKAIEKVKKKLERSKNPKEYMSNYGYKKYLTVSLEGNSKIKLNKERIIQEARWDGLHGVFTNNFNMDEEEILNQYRNLWQVEESFRITKHDLKIRPVYHWKPSRVKAHIAICFAAFMLTRYVEHRVRLQYKKLSINEIRKTLLSVQNTIVVDPKRRIRYVIPSNARSEARKIYNIFSIERDITPYILEKY